MRIPFFLFTSSCLLCALPAAEPDEMERPLPAENSHPGGFVFSLLPKSFQRHPSVDFNVITEMTAEGKKFPKPTSRQPIYYVEQPGRFTQMGTESPANEHPPPIADLERAMQKALATNGYLAGREAAPAPRLLVVFNFGSFARFSTGMEEAEQEAEAEQAYEEAISQQPPPNPPPDPPEGAQLSPDTADQLLPYVMADVAKRRDVLERASLVAGAKFAKEFGDAIEQEIQYRQSHAGFGPPEEDPASPFNLFRNRNEKLVYFVEESFSSCYFVIASAYDYAAMGRGQRVLLWRTKMTVNSLGISMTESLPSLIVSAGPYLGREMNEAAVMTRRISREGHVEIGTPTVVDDNAAVAAPKPATSDKSPAPAKP